VIWYCRARTL